ncbi:hypothetical protein LF41_584 [Lysobacter dokdonensis DS-58]|uniref:Secreted protein n=1 Tax=Lysobacter dokdonensis DS-58 TaxID=1300345 RepID=A0A0A2WFN2_9GAMM|nr:hypothetical protein [Lysobacter dokdonensis]KGQ18558.1 hypothetical protein LF41_584 [Lysobacter dokdonensis DS-58]
MQFQRTVIFIAACLCATAASAADFASKFGVQFDVSAPWHALDPARLPDSRDPFIESLRNGSVEVFFYGNSGNNVNLSLSPGAPVQDKKSADTYCRSAEKELSGPTGKANVQACKLGTRNGVPYFFVEWKNLSTAHTLFHAEIAMPGGKLLLVAGESDAASADAVRAMQMRVVDAATLMAATKARPG